MNFQPTTKTEPDPKTYLKKKSIYIYIKRMLFTCKNCRCCKKEMTDIKVLLNNIFPAGICDEICDYNLYCSKCKDLNDKERTYKEVIYHFDFESWQLTTTEKQIYLFQTSMNKSPIFLSNTNRTNTRIMKREIDESMDRSDCRIELLNNRLFFQAIKFKSQPM